MLLPGAELLGAEAAPARELADAGAICVLATDCNPGTSPVASLPLIIGLAVRRYGWSAREALPPARSTPPGCSGYDDRGSLELGKRADVVLLDGPVEHVPYRFGHNPVAEVIAAVIAWADLDQACSRDLVPIVGSTRERRRGPRRGWRGRARTSRRRRGSARRARRSGGGRARPGRLLWACPDAPGPWWAVGSHLDTVRAAAASTARSGWPPASRSPSACRWR